MIQERSMDEYRLVFGADSSKKSASLDKLLLQGKGEVADIRANNDFVWCLQERPDDSSGVNICFAIKTITPGFINHPASEKWEFHAVPAVLTTKGWQIGTDPADVTNKVNLTDATAPTTINKLLENLQKPEVIKQIAKTCNVVNFGPQFKQETSVVVGQSTADTHRTTFAANPIFKDCTTQNIKTPTRSNEELNDHKEKIKARVLKANNKISTAKKVLQKELLNLNELNEITKEKQQEYKMAQDSLQRGLNKEDLASSRVVNPIANRQQRVNEAEEAVFEAENSVKLAGTKIAMLEVNVKIAEAEKKKDSTNPQEIEKGENELKELQKEKDYLTTNQEAVSARIEADRMARIAKAQQEIAITVQDLQSRLNQTNMTFEVYDAAVTQLAKIAKELQVDKTLVRTLENAKNPAKRLPIVDSVTKAVMAIVEQAQQNAAKAEVDALAKETVAHTREKVRTQTAAPRPQSEPTFSTGTTHLKIIKKIVTDPAATLSAQTAASNPTSPQANPAPTHTEASASKRFHVTFPTADQARSETPEPTSPRRPGKGAG